MLKNPFPSKAYCLKYSTRNCFTDISEGLKLTWCPPLPCKKKKKNHENKERTVQGISDY